MPPLLSVHWHPPPFVRHLHVGVLPQLDGKPLHV
jgi:hypothetical protein